MTTVAYLEDRPAWTTTIWAVFRGYVIALVFLGIGLSLLSALGLGIVPRGAAEPGPWPVDGVWSVVANAYLYVGVVLFASFVLYISATTTLQRPISPLVVLGAVAVTGYAPYLHLRWLESSLVALLLTAAAIRYLGVDRFHSLRLGRAGLAALLAVLAAGTIATVAYATAHPLVVDETGGGSVDGTEFYVSATMRNNGFADLRITAIEPGTAMAGGVPWDRERLVGRVLSARDEVRISFPQDVCPLDAVVRYELAGRLFEQRLVVDHCG